MWPLMGNSLSAVFGRELVWNSNFNFRIHQIRGFIVFHFFELSIPPPPVFFHPEASWRWGEVHQPSKVQQMQQFLEFFLGLGSERPTNLKKSPKIDFHSGTVPKFHHVSHHFDRVRSWGGLAPGLGLPPMTDGEPISFRPCQPRLHVPVWSGSYNHR